MSSHISKADLLVQIHDLVEQYIEQELSARYSNILQENNADEEFDVVVESDSDGDDIDTNTGDIWDLEKQEIIGTKDLKTGQKVFFSEQSTPDDDDA